MSNETDHLEGFWGRINHPVFGVFASAWLAINWELVYTLIRGLADVPATIAQINTIRNKGGLAYIFHFSLPFRLKAQITS